MSTATENPSRSSGSGALLALGAAFVAGIVLAKSVDWMGHGHPKQ